tara:strand:+ start:450 stop:1064 length:615 start_codon:yes stop_codon:yes gene_type:complete
VLVLIDKGELVNNEEKESPSGLPDRSGTSYSSEFFERNSSRTPRIVKFFLFIFLFIAWTGSAIGIWWDITQIQEKGIFELADPACDEENEAFISEMHLQIADFELELAADVQAGRISQAAADERIEDLKGRLDNYEEESDCYRSGIILIVAGAFIVISVPLTIIAVIRGRRKGKTDFNPPNSKRRKKESDPYSDFDDFDNPILS